MIIIISIISIIIIIIIYKLSKFDYKINQLKFVIVVNSSNILTYESIFRQTFFNYRLLVLGEDNIQIIKYWSMQHRTTFIDSMNNFDIKDDEITIFLDDNYRFINNHVLMYLNYIFNTENVQLIINNKILYNGQNKEINNIIGYNKVKYSRNISFPIIELLDKSRLPLLIKGDNLNNCEILLINLRRRNDRLDFMKFKLKDFKYNISIWYAIDGYSVENIKLFDTLKDTKIKSPGALGLLLTYRNLIDYCLDKNLDRVILLEDDIYLSDEFLNYDFNSLKEDVIYLGANQSNFSNEQLLPIENNSYYNVDNKNYTYGTYGISLSKSFLQKLKQELLNLQNPIDVVIYKLINNNGIVIYPNLVIPELRESENMGKRDLNEFSNKRKWDLTKYKDINYYNTFISDFNLKQILELTNNNTFVFIIPSYNNEQWVEKNLLSVINQLYPLWRIIYIDDNSNDSTVNLVNNIIDKYDIKDKFTLIKNNVRMYQAYSRYVAYTKANDNEIILFLDGDDWLYDDKVLHYLNALYKKGYECTYGRFCTYNQNIYSGILGFNEFPKEIVEKKEYRKYKWISQHLRTCRAKLIKNISELHLKDREGNWLKYCTDLAEMFWILEQSNGKHINSGRLLYVYNKENSKKYEYSSYRQEQKKYRQEVEEYIRNLNPSFSQ